MAPSKTRAELEAEIAELRKLHTEDNCQATFFGWTREGEDAHRERIARIGALHRELKAFDERQQ